MIVIVIDMPTTMLWRNKSLLYEGLGFDCGN